MTNNTAAVLWHRYHHDARFHHLVNWFAVSFETGQLTVGDVLDALRLAHDKVTEAEVAKRANEVRLHIPETPAQRGAHE